MRHVGSILLASILAPAIFLLTGAGLSAIDSARKDSFTDDPFGALAALGTLLLAGLIYGILVMVRLSPVGPGLAGLALMGMSGWAVLAPSSYEKSLGLIDVHMGGAVGQWGLGMLLGAPLIATLTSPRRWRTQDNGYANDDHAGMAQPSTSDPTRLTPALPTSKTLYDPAPASLRDPPVASQPPAATSPARPAAEAPTVRIASSPPPIGLAPAVPTIRLDPLAPHGKPASPTADQPTSAAPPAASTPPQIPSQQPGPPLPRRIPTVPPTTVNATSRTDGLAAAPAQDPPNPRSGIAPNETAAAAAPPASSRLDTAPTQDVALPNPANTTAQMQADKGEQPQEP